MGNGVPLLNEYKQEFFAKRFPQTILGGLKMKIGYDTPAYVYINQLILFFIPFIIGGMFTLLVELKVLEDYIAIYVYGAVMAVFVLITQIISSVVQDKQGIEMPLIRKKKNLLAEEDEVDFISCCDSETLKFVVPPKKYKINIVFHALIAGPLCGLSFWYLLPSTLNKLYYYNVGATVVLFIFGWITVIIGNYPLTVAAPPETATYRTTNFLELSALMRPFYIYLFIAIDLLHRFLSTDFLLVNQVLHIIFIFLPLFWTIGFLSPVDTFFLWLFEQAHVFILGGSFMASNIRLIVMLVISVGVYLGTYYFQSCLAKVVFSACFGYFLSTDLSGLGCQVIHFFQHRNKVFGSTIQLVSSIDKTSPEPKFLWRWGPLIFLYHFVILAIVGVEAGLLNYNSQWLPSDVRNILGYCIIGLCVMEKILRDIQNVYIVFGLWRNMLFPSSLQRSTPFKTRKKCLKLLGMMRRAIVNWIGPYIMLAYLSLSVTSSSTFCRNPDLATAVWYTFGIVRAFRWIWQSTVHSLLELSVVHIIQVVLSDNSTLSSLGVPILALIVGICRDRFFQVLNKLYFFFTLLITSWTDKKQRRESTIPIITVSVILFPVIFCLVLLASVISASLLPLFTLPVFFLAFPRPLRSWPEPVGASASACPDTNFYKQLAPVLSKTLWKGFASGSLGEPNPGNHYLARFQDRLVWIQILERGAGYCCVSIKGLELQETSCHTAEAARIDEIFEAAFEKDGGSPLGSLNPYPLHTLTSVDAAYLKTYSDAKNVLTGIIDNPNSVPMTMDAFLKSLVWVLLHYVNEMKRKEAKINKEKSKVSTDLLISSKAEKHELKEANFNKTSQALVEKVKPKLEPVQPLVPIVEILDSTDRTFSPLPPIGNANLKRKSSWGSLDSFTESIFSDSGDERSKKKGKPKVSDSGDSYYGPLVVSKGNSPLKKSKDIDDLFQELDLGLPAVNVTKSKEIFEANARIQQSHGYKQSYGSAIYKPQTNLAGSPDFKCPFSVHMSLPKSWREIPLDQGQVSRQLGKFPQDWFKYVLSTLDWSAFGNPSHDVVSQVTQDEILLKCYAQLIMACYSIYDAQGGFGGAHFLYKCYIGDMPWNAMLDWLSENRELQGLVAKAFRYGFKLMLDQTLLGEVTSPAELKEYLEGYDQDWYIGLERDPHWTHAVLASKPNLFSLDHINTQGTYSSRTLTLQDVAVSIGSLNGEVVRGQWANLGLELLYLTNDDEERYSIQAHPTILRNLTVQAADPPLGYPIYSSEPVFVPTL
ncbi:hypothetical protein CHS0354_032942 [Potamilus streckersoni]|uniref:Pecanex-like protein n=1 Tax=Potamilus streckersoni TaxID=2493646 RepID=A0AAE0RWM9_9BIVA|nr:hypothetical protein CHS0354_032942 [Potamilus streckersoni]